MIHSVDMIKSNKNTTISRSLLHKHTQNIRKDYHRSKTFREPEDNKNNTEKMMKWNRSGRTQRTVDKLPRPPEILTKFQ